ncbi:MAG TPA: GH25 family lysozyme [Flavobacteriales bacterium]|nr:GH25 family lysozyme [Flavobacteriales bacterium]
MRKLFNILFLLFLIASGIFGYYMYTLYNRDNLQYINRNNYPVQGIDISHHQGSIDWSELKKEKFHFVFMKATEGNNFTDPQFSNYLWKAKPAGYLLGAYHFFSFCKPGNEQAAHFIEVVPRNMDILPILDLEFDSHNECGKKRKEVIAEVDAFVEKIKKHYGRTPVLYMPIAFYRRYGKGNFTGCELWVRNVHGDPKLPGNRGWQFWQYADRGKVKGINGYVDLNAFNGNLASFKKYMAQ